MPICCSSLLDPCPQLISFVLFSWVVTSVPALVPVPRRYSWKAGMFYSLLPSELCVFCRYVTGHIWACPPSEGDDYIFHCHPPDQKIPKPKRLQEWYKKMLDKAFAERIIHDYKVRVPGEGAGQGQGNLCRQGEGLGSWAPAPDWRTGLAFADLNGAQTAGISGASLGLRPSQAPAQN